MVLVFTSPVFGVVRIFDGFGDADLNNNGVPLEPFDVDVNGAGDGTAGDSYVALDNEGSPMVFPEDTMVQEVTSVEDASDTGIRWYSIGGFTSSGTGDPAANARILNDSTGHLPETNSEIGFYNSIANENQVAAAIDSGHALAFESKGRTRGVAGFFDDDYSDGNQGTVELGPEVGDRVSVSFDFRVWMSAANFNGGDNHMPVLGELRFGLYQDTDNELGSVNNFAGRSDPDTGIPVAATWGEEPGLFRGDAPTDGPDATGDHGWYAKMPLKDPDSPAGLPLDGGASARIVEEVNEDSTSAQIFGGSLDTDTVAAPDIVEPNFVNLELTKVYNLSLTLERFDESGTGGTTGDNIMATLAVEDLAAEQTYTLSGFDPVGMPGTNDPDGGFESESWDYFAMQLAGSSSSDDFDFLIDNFTVEVEGSNVASADADGDGDVDGFDFLMIQRDNPELISLWESQYGSNSSSPLAVPEPNCIVLWLLGILGLRFVRCPSRTS